MEKKKTSEKKKTHKDINMKNTEKRMKKKEKVQKMMTMRSNVGIAGKEEANYEHKIDENAIKEEEKRRKKRKQGEQRKKRKKKKGK